MSCGKQTPTLSKLSPPRQSHLKPISSTPGYRPWCYGGTVVLHVNVNSGVHHLHLRIHVNDDKVLDIIMYDILLFETPVCMWGNSMHI
jgi:hypothetical protein